MPTLYSENEMRRKKFEFHISHSHSSLSMNWEMQEWNLLLHNSTLLKTETMKWIAASGNVPSNMRRMCGFTSFCRCAKPHPALCSPVKCSIVFNESVCGQRKPWSDCADAQADLGIRCPHMPEDTFSHHGGSKCDIMKYCMKYEVLNVTFNWPFRMIIF